MSSIGINGFGRVGRAVLRASLAAADVNVTCINDPFLNVEYIAYLIKHDTTHGRLNATVEIKGASIVVDGHAINVYACSEPTRIPWGENGVEYVVEASGVFTTLERAGLHLAGGAQRVIITAPSADAPMFVMGVNEEKYRPENQIMSCSSCTTHALLPLLKVLNDTVGVSEAMFTAVHAATPTMKPVDGSQPKDWRMGRSAMSNIIPTQSGATKCVAKVLPYLGSKVTGMAMRVPVQDVSVLDVTVKTEKPLPKEALDALFRDVQNNERLRGIIAFADEPMVSSDFVSHQASCVYDATASTSLNDTMHKIVAWYDNEYGYASRVLDLVRHTSKIR